MRFAATLSLLAGLLVLAGCMGDGETKTVTVRETVTETGASGTVPSEEPALVTLYFLRDGKVAAEVRGIVSRPDIAAVTIHQLFEGTESDLTTAIPPETRLRRLTIDGGVATIELTPPLKNRKALAQITYTLTQFETVKRVSFNGQRPVGRAAFEQQTPAIFVESPLPYEEVEPGFEASGTANTFEATFQYEVVDMGGSVIDGNVVTATSGTGTRGTFDFTTGAFDDISALRLFEFSAKDGSRVNEVELPLRTGS
jgi:germination protein M